MTIAVYWDVKHQIKQTNKLLCEKSCEHSSCFIFNSINLILVGNKDMHESLDDFKFWSNTTTNSRVIRPCTSEKLIYNVVNTLAPTFSIGSSSFLQVTRKTNQVWTEFEFWPDGTKGCRVTALDRCQKLVFVQYLENGWTEFNQIL